MSTDRAEQFHQFVLGRRPGLRRTAMLLLARDKHLTGNPARPAPTRPSTSPAESPRRLPLPAEPRHRWREASLAAAAVWAVVTVTHLGVQMLAWLPRGDGGSPPAATQLLLSLNQWDTGHYLRIAEFGYQADPASPAFFPLYPMLIRVTDVILPGGALVAALLVANSAVFGALTMLYRLTHHEFGTRVAQRAIWYLAAFPTGFFLFIGYNESLFILLMTGALYAGRRGHWWLAGVLGALSSATRLFGVLLMVPLAMEYVRQIGWRPQRIRLDVLSLAAVPMGAAAYSLYCLLVLDDPLAFSKAQEQWGRHYTFPGEAWVNAVQRAGGGLLSADTLGAALDAGTVLVVAILLILCVAGPARFRRDQMYLVVHGVLIVALLTSTELWFRPMMSSSRYVLEVLAIFIVLARLGAQPVIDRAILVIGAALHAAFLTIFVAGTFFIA
ncbi:mannosyltransferase family protein [Actinoplanes sp. NPDC020271]|uniref:mannosyltransferase family protein n=1 Tax=Actinoplanes sp. NPDC020271 TaxID=3363896 RepID=UPI0037A9E1D6